MTIPESMDSLHRYVLAPIPGAPATEKWERRERLTPAGRVYLRIGIERALERAARAVVHLVPRPLTTIKKPPFGVGSEFAMAATSALPDLVSQAMRALWGLGYICPQRPDVLPVRRLGLSAFSGGGGGLIKALAASPQAVSEVYAFDADGFETSTTAAMLGRWAALHANDMRLRMTESTRTPDATTVSIASIKSQLSGSVPPEWLTAAPSSPAFWAPGGERWWDYVLQDVWADQRKDWDTRHQFAIYGGRNLGANETPAVSGVTWLEEFLLGSGF